MQYTYRADILSDVCLNGTCLIQYTQGKCSLLIWVHYNSNILVLQVGQNVVEFWSEIRTFSSENGCAYCYMHVCFA